MGSPNHPSMMRTSPYAGAKPFRPYPFELWSKAAPGHHQRCTSESNIVEKPPWFDDLLNEPDHNSLLQGIKGHRRSSSDSAFISTLENNQNENKEKSKLENFSTNEDMWKGSFKEIQNFPDQQNSEVGKPSLSSEICSNSSDGNGFEMSPSSSMIAKKYNNQEEDIDSSKLGELGEKSSVSQTKPFTLKGDDKRTKQCRQSAHRSRTRKLQYIADLERDIQVLQVEGSEFSAALQFLDQQKFTLDMENRALRQQLDSLSQEHMIQQLEQKMLEREVGRLRAFYQIQMQQQPKRRRNKKRDQINPQLPQAIYHN